MTSIISNHLWQSIQNHKYTIKGNARVLIPVVASITSILASVYLVKTKHHKPTTPLPKQNQFTTIPSLKLKVGVNREFVRQLKAILSICIPRYQSKEALIILLHTLFFLLRTYLSVVVARIDGRIVRDLVSANGQQFLIGLGYWFAIAVPATYTNSMIRFLQSKLAIAFRTRLTHYVNQLYLDEKQGFYKLIHLDLRIESADQFIVTDIARFCDAIASLYSNVGKPLIDIVIFNVQLARYIGYKGMFGLIFNYLVTARLLKLATPSFGKLAAHEALLEGQFRTAHTKLTTNAEEICFYGGESREKAVLNKAYQVLVKHINSIYKTRIVYNMFEDFLIKYVWSAVGLGVCAIPVFFPSLTLHHHHPTTHDTDMDESTVVYRDKAIMQGSSNMPEDMDVVDPSPKSTQNHTQAFITNKRLLLSLADAGGRIMQSLKEISELAGLTVRVYTLISVLHAVHNNQFQGDPNVPYSLGAIHGIVQEGGPNVVFEHVDIVVPNRLGASGQVLVSNMHLTLEQGDHMLIQGGNGMGKTSIARVLSGLWPLLEGKLARPSSVLYIPQRPYLVIGSLRDQVIYPDNVELMSRKGRSDSDLKRILELVHLEYLPDREGGWDTVKEWKDVCSGGEKQRLNVARLFYHAPKWAILDECTSAVSNDVEGLMYTRAKELGITLITISHRSALAKYHRLLFKILDDGQAYEVTRIGTEAEVMSIQSEINSIEQRIRELPKHKRRLEQVNVELGLGQK